MYKLSSEPAYNHTFIHTYISNRPYEHIGCGVGHEIPLKLQQRAAKVFKSGLLIRIRREQPPMYV